MKLIFARLVCLNAVILLTSGILFGAIDLKSSVSTSINKIHFSSKSELSIGSFSFIEEEEEDDENHILNLPFLFDYTPCSTDYKKLENLNQINSKYQPNSTDKTPIWIKIRHIII